MGVSSQMLHFVAAQMSAAAHELTSITQPVSGDIPVILQDKKSHH